MSDRAAFGKFFTNGLVLCQVGLCLCLAGCGVWFIGLLASPGSLSAVILMSLAGFGAFSAGWLAVITGWFFCALAQGVSTRARRCAWLGIASGIVALGSAVVLLSGSPGISGFVGPYTKLGFQVVAMLAAVSHAGGLISFAYSLSDAALINRWLARLFALFQSACLIWHGLLIFVVDVKLVSIEKYALPPTLVALAGGYLMLFCLTFRSRSAIISMGATR